MDIDASKITRIYMGLGSYCGDYVERGEPMFDARLKRFLRMATVYCIDQEDIGENYIKLRHGQDSVLTAYFD